MKRKLTILLLPFIALTLANAQAPKKVINNCATCHAGLDAKNAAIVEGFKKDIHAEMGLTCADCHGGVASLNDIDAMDPGKGFKGKPEPKDIPMFCAKCHADANYMRHYSTKLNVDQFEKYKTSKHGLLLAKGDKKVATCISCHGVHGILAVDNPNAPVYKTNVPETCSHCHSNKSYMAEYGIPTNQYESYTQGVHGIALLQKHTKGAPACNDCHGNHGATPPGIDDIATVCMSCHSFNGDLFNHSPHKDGFKQANLSSCVACHSNHKINHPTDDMVGVGPSGLCAKCHQPNTPGYIAGAKMKRLLDSLQEKELETRNVLAKAKELDMDVSDGEMKIETIRENMIESRTAIHAFSDAHLAEVTVKGFAAASQASKVATDAIYEYKYRRIGFGIATLVITCLALLLWLKIRQIERKSKQ